MRAAAAERCGLCRRFAGAGEAHADRVRRRRVVGGEGDADDVGAAPGGRQYDLRGARALRQQRRGDGRPRQEGAALGGQRLPTPLGEAGERRREREHREQAEGLGAEQAWSGAAGGARRRGIAGGAARRSPRGQPARGGHHRDGDGLRDHHVPVAGPAQEVPVVDLAHRGEHPRDRRQTERADRERGERACAVGQPDGAAAGEQHERHDPADPQPGRQHVRDLRDQLERGRVRERVPGRRVGDERRGPSRRVHGVAGAAAVAGDAERRGRGQEHAGAHELRPPRGRPRQQPEVELAARARGRARDHALARGREQQQPRQRRNRADGLGRVRDAPPAQQRDEREPAEQRRGGDDPHPARDDRNRALGRGALPSAAARAGPAEALGAGRRRALRAGHAERERPADRVPVVAERRPAHGVHGGAQRPGRADGQRAPAVRGRQAPDRHAATARRHSDSRPTGDRRLAQREADGRRRLRSDQPRRRRGLQQQGMRRRGRRPGAQGTERGGRADQETAAHPDARSASSSRRAALRWRGSSSSARAPSSVR